MEWFVVAALIGLVMAIVPSTRSANVYGGVLFGGVVYLAVGALLAKLGYQKPSLLHPTRLSADRATRPTHPAAASTRPPRARPAPTKRTNANQRRR